MQMGRLQFPDCPATVFALLHFRSPWKSVTSSASLLSRAVQQWGFVVFVFGGYYAGYVGQNIPFFLAYQADALVFCAIYPAHRDYFIANRTLNHDTKSKATGLLFPRYLALIAVPYGRPGSFCQASQV